jgi:hypothetical protein
MQVNGLRVLGALVAVMWAVELVNALDSYRLDRDGIVPRNFSHLDGILFAPFLHASFSHLLGNTVPFIILGFAIAFAGARRLLLVTLIAALVSGLGVWCARAASHSPAGRRRSRSADRPLRGRSRSLPSVEICDDHLEKAFDVQRLGQVLAGAEP